MAHDLASLPMLFPDVVQDDIVPTFVYGGGRVRNAAVINTSIFNMTNDVTTYDVLANLTKVLGSHALKAGLYVQRSLKDVAQIDGVNGSTVTESDSNTSLVFGAGVSWSFSDAAGVRLQLDAVGIDAMAAAPGPAAPCSRHARCSSGRRAG